jgi:putative transposase
VHLIQRGNNRSACFFTEDDYAFYLDQLGMLCRLAAIALHAYVLMTHHLYLLLTSTQAEEPSRLMKQLGQRYVQYLNRCYRRSGTLWEDRFRLINGLSPSHSISRRNPDRKEGRWWRG